MNKHKPHIKVWRDKSSNKLFWHARVWLNGEWVNSIDVSPRHAYWRLREAIVQLKKTYPRVKLDM